MKICERCGHQNWKPSKKCDGCKKEFKQPAQCDPMIGNTELVLDDEGRLVQTRSIGPINSTRGYK